MSIERKRSIKSNLYNKLPLTHFSLYRIQFGFLMLNRVVSSSFRKPLTICSKSFPIHDVKILEDVITNEESMKLYDSFKTRIERRKYNKGHWDKVIQNYRELEILDHEWKDNSTLDIINRVRHLIENEINEKIKWLPSHVIDLHEEGFIDTHVDSIKFSGKLVCGLSFNSSAIMTLTPSNDGKKQQQQDVTSHVQDDESFCKLMLPINSLYILKDQARYNYGHSVRSQNDGVQDWHGEKIESLRRISIIFRDKL